VWREGFSAWRKAGDVPEFNGQLVEPPPLPPVPAMMKKPDPRNNSQARISRATMVTVTSVVTLILSVVLDADAANFAAGRLPIFSGP
jgi:hypothetical protein